MKTGIAVIGIIIVVFLGWMLFVEKGEAPDDGVIVDTREATYEERVQVESPTERQVVSSRFTVSGQARGFWFFEASFPVEITDENGNQLLIVPAQAKEDWMTEDFVPFEVLIDVGDYEGRAWVILHRDNASGLPEHDASVRIPIIIGE